MERCANMSELCIQFLNGTWCCCDASLRFWSAQFALGSCCLLKYAEVVTGLQLPNFEENQQLTVINNSFSFNFQVLGWRKFHVDVSRRSWVAEGSQLRSSFQVSTSHLGCCPRRAPATRAGPPWFKGRPAWNHGFLRWNTGVPVDFPSNPLTTGFVAELFVGPSSPSYGWWTQ